MATKGKAEDTKRVRVDEAKIIQMVTEIEEKKIRLEHEIGKLTREQMSLLADLAEASNSPVLHIGDTIQANFGDLRTRMMSGEYTVTKYNSFIAHEPMKDDQGNYTGDYDVTIALKSKGVKKRSRGDKLGDKLRDLATKVYSETIARKRVFSDDDNIQDILSYTRRAGND